jgi:predicted PurR-regulated permease PerM
VWPFLTEMLRQGGTVAVLFSVLGGAALLTIRVLWAQHLRLTERMVEQNEQYLQRFEQLRQQLNELQERRVEETRNITTKVVEHVARVDHSMEKVATTLDVLIELSGKRR